MCAPSQSENLASPGPSLAGPAPKKDKRGEKKPYDKPAAAAGPSTPKKKRGGAAGGGAHAGEGEGQSYGGETMTKSAALEEYPQLEWFHLESIHYTTKRNPHGGPYPMKLFSCEDVAELAAKVDAGGWKGKSPKKKKAARDLDFEPDEMWERDGDYDFEEDYMPAPPPPPPTDPTSVVAWSYAKNSYKLSNGDLAVLRYEDKPLARGGTYKALNRCEVEALAVQKHGKEYFDLHLKPQADRMRAARARGRR